MENGNKLRLLWVFGWNDGIKIIMPENIREEYKKRLKKVLEN